MAISGVSPLSLSLSPSAANHACSLFSLAYKRRDAATLRLTTGVLPPPRIEIDAPPPPRRASPPSTWRRWRGGTRRAAWRRREGEKSSGTWVDLEVRTSLRGSGRGEGGVLLYRCIYTRRKLLYIRAPDVPRPRTRPRARIHVHTRAPPPSSRNYPLMHRRREDARARSTIACPADAIRSMGAIFAYCGFQKRRCATSPLSSSSPPEYLGLLAVE